MPLRYLFSNSLFNRVLIKHPYNKQRNIKQVSTIQSADNVSFATKLTGIMK
jgi:hypothetical protein